MLKLKKITILHSKYNQMLLLANSFVYGTPYCRNALCINIYTIKLHMQPDSFRYLRQRKSDHVHSLVVSIVAIRQRDVLFFFREPPYSRVKKEIKSYMGSIILIHVTDFVPYKASIKLSVPV